jgi:phosphate-transporting ATPase
MTAAVLRVEGLRRPPLEPVSLCLAGGEILAVSGPSGAGKSLLMRAIADLDPASGAVQLDDRRREDWSGPQWRALVTYLPPVPGWWEDRVIDHFRDAHRDAARDLLEALALPGGILERPVADVSTGEAQRIGLARALVQQPRVLLLDEPTSSLDPAGTRQVERLLGDWLSGDRAILVNSHDEEQAERLAHRRLTMNNGRLAAA